MSQRRSNQLFTKIALFALGLALSTSVTAGFLSYTLFRENLLQIAEKNQSFHSQLLAERIKDKIDHVYKKAAFLLEGTGIRFQSRSEKLEFLKKHLSNNPEILAISLYTQTKETWRTSLLLTRSMTDPTRIGSKEIGFLDDHYPFLPLYQEPTLVAAEFESTLPVFRMAFQRKEDETVVVELSDAFLQDAFSKKRTEHQFIISQNNRLIAQSSSSNFGVREDLSHLPLVQEMQKNLKENQNDLLVRYHELPGAPKQVAHVSRISGTRWLVVSQIQEDAIYQDVQMRALQVFQFSLFVTGLLAIGFLIWTKKWIQINTKKSTTTHHESSSEPQLVSSKKINP